MTDLGGATTYPDWDCAFYRNGRPALLPGAYPAMGYERCTACKASVFTGRLLHTSANHPRQIQNTEPPFVCDSCAAREAAA